MEQGTRDRAIIGAKKAERNLRHETKQGFLHRSYTDFTSQAVHESIGTELRQQGNTESLNA